MRPSYKNAIQWIALNDDPKSGWALTVDMVRYHTTVALVAGVWGKSNERVGADVVKLRKKLESRA